MGQTGIRLPPDCGLDSDARATMPLSPLRLLSGVSNRVHPMRILAEPLSLASQNLSDTTERSSRKADRICEALPKEVVWPRRVRSEQSESNNERRHEGGN